jgi:hypothetical protein
VAEEDREKPEPPPAPRAPPTPLSSHLGAAASYFYVVGDKAGGARIDVSAGGRVGQSLWLGGVVGAWLGSTPAGSLALRLSSYSDKPVAYMLGIDAGAIYLGANRTFLPYGNVHPLGLSVRTSVLIIEARISLAVMVNAAGLHWVPSGGVEVLF